MTHYAPGSQSQNLMAEKQALARRLVAQKLSVRQICQQLRCSPTFVRQQRVLRLALLEQGRAGSVLKRSSRNLRNHPRGTARRIAPAVTPSRSR